MARSAVNKEYHVDFVALMRLYEANYTKFNTLLPILHEVGDTRTYQVKSQVYQINVIEVTRYTTLVELFQCDQALIYPLPRMTVRLYHDAKVAEVCTSEKMKAVHARYDYPNSKMMQKDEKHQLNQFLGDWLTFCLKMGIRRKPLL